MPIIADEVNEEWLEKKMLCFFRRNARIHPVNFTLYSPLSTIEKCHDSDCPFCFPAEKDAIKKLIHSLETPPTPKEASDKAVKHIMEEVNAVLEDPREKESVEKCPKCKETMYQCNELKLSMPPQPVYRCAKCDDGQASRKKVTVDEMMKLIQDYCYDFYGDPEAENPRLQRTLEYLISLQEKENAN